VDVERRINDSNIRAKIFDLMRFVTNNSERIDQPYSSAELISFHLWINRYCYGTDSPTRQECFREQQFAVAPNRDARSLAHTMLSQVVRKCLVPTLGLRERHRLALDCEEGFVWPLLGLLPQQVGQR
jgi:hypothetical protein